MPVPAAINGQMRVAEVIALVPQAAEIMAEYGLHCFSCHIGGTETLEEGCRIHGFSEEVTRELIDDINQSIQNTAERPRNITVTPSAAQGIRGIAEQEARKSAILRVEVDSTGGFCLEFTDEVPGGDLVFSCPEEPDVRVCASLLALQRIGGSTIDMRDGRFKLDLPEDARSCGDCGDACSCD